MDGFSLLLQLIQDKQWGHLPKLSRLSSILGLSVLKFLVSQSSIMRILLRIESRNQLFDMLEAEEI
jgi:hypothetical protein